MTTKETVEIALTASTLFAALGFMTTAFILIARRGGWEKAMQKTATEGQWPAQRILMIIGASLGCLFGILFWLFNQ